MIIVNKNKDVEILHIIDGHNTEVYISGSNRKPFTLSVKHWVSKWNIMVTSVFTYNSKEDQKEYLNLLQDKNELIKFIEKIDHPDFF